MKVDHQNLTFTCKSVMFPALRLRCIAMAYVRYNKGQPIVHSNSDLSSNKRAAFRIAELAASESGRHALFESAVKYEMSEAEIRIVLHIDGSG